MKILFLLVLTAFNFTASYSQTPQYPATITVAKDGSGNYKTIQEAINSVRDLGQQRVTIRVKAGVYKEKLVVPSWKTNISLVGEDKETTIITNNDYSGKAFPGKDASGKDKYMTFTSYTLLVEGNDFVAENLTIENNAGRVGQAVALHVEGDRSMFKNCKLIGNQDTLYAAKENSRQYYEDCFIEGTTDFIFGEAIAVFKRCIIKALTNSFITAASTRQQQKFGFVFLNCSLIADSSATKVYLGRPWRPFAKTVFINTNMDSHITKEGWDPWKGDVMFPGKDKTVYYAEYKSYGQGADITSRVKWSKQLTKKQAAAYTLINIFAGWEPGK